MSYVRFENTYHDLQDRYENMESEDLNDSEERYRKKLVELCLMVANDYADQCDL